MTKSVLDTVSGIGPKRKKELLKHFKSMKQMRLASVEQLSEVIPEDVNVDAAFLHFAKLVVDGGAEKAHGGRETRKSFSQ